MQIIIAVAIALLTQPVQTWLGLSTETPAAAQEDIDAFMAEVLSRRNHNWNNQYNYIFSEREALEITGTIQAAPIQGFTGEYVWYVRDGYLVRSPVSVNDAKVPDGERVKQEDEWIESLKEGKRSGGGLDRDQFFGLDFKKGEFLFAGTTELQGREVAVIEFYPEGAFDDDDDEDEDELDERIERGLEKTMMVTLYVVPEEKQIVRMTLNNAGFDFLPGRWLVRVDKVQASMTMHQPYGDDWLPLEMVAYGSVTTASGNLAVRFTRSFYDYRVSDVRVKFRFPPRSEKK